MTLSDYLLNGALVALVVVQVRPRRLTLHSLVLPVAAVAWAAAQYLHAIPTAGNDLVLAMAGALVGGALGVACSLATSVTVGADGVVRSKGGALAAVLWVAGVGARLAFELYATHGGARALGRFSVAHDITSGRAWVACLVLMALCEVVLRTGVLAGRRVTVRNRTAARPTGAAGGPTTRSAGRAPSRVMMGADVPGR